MGEQHGINVMGFKAEVSYDRDVLIAYVKHSYACFFSDYCHVQGQDSRLGAVERSPMHEPRYNDILLEACSSLKR